MTLCIGFGFFISANYTLASVITIQILCLYDFQTGYGILCLVEGLGNLVGPALIGKLQFKSLIFSSERNKNILNFISIIFADIIIFFIGGENVLYTFHLYARIYV